MASRVPPERIHATASKFAQLLGETIVHHAPWTSEITEQTRRRITDEWLESLEQHGTEVMAPFVDMVLAASDAPPEIKQLLEHAVRPTAQFGSTIQQFFIYGVMFSLANTALAPFTQQIANDIWAAHPTKPLGPPDIATMVVRGITPGENPITPMPSWASNMANKTGISNEDMQALIDATGMPPSPQDLFEMVRRSIITEAQLVQGLKEGDTRDEWIPEFSQLRYVTPTPVDMVRAAVQEQLSYSEASNLAAQLGLEPAGWIKNNPDWFKVLYDIAGRPPGPVEMGHAAMRGIIPWSGVGPSKLTFQQAIAESDIKTKWTPVLEELAYYWPPPGEVKLLLMHGGIDRKQATAYWQADGIPAKLATAYAHLAEVEQITQDKALAKGDIETLVEESIIDDKTALDLLDLIGYSGTAAGYIVNMAHARYELEALRTAVRKVETLYTTHKITTVEAKDALKAVGIPEEQVSRLLTTLESQRSAEVATLTAAQVAGGLHYGVITQDIAMTYLSQLGYEPWDAWAFLSIREHGPLPGEPARPGTLIG